MNKKIIKILFVITILFTFNTMKVNANNLLNINKKSVVKKVDSKTNNIKAALSQDVSDSSIAENIQSTSAFNDNSGTYTVSISNNTKNFKVVLYSLKTKEVTMTSTDTSFSKNVPYNYGNIAIVVCNTDQPCTLLDDNSQEQTNNTNLAVFEVSLSEKTQNLLYNSVACNSFRSENSSLATNIDECYYRYRNAKDTEISIQELGQKIADLKNKYEGSSASTYNTPITPTSNESNTSETKSCSFNSSTNYSIANYNLKEAREYWQMECTETDTYTYSTPKYAIKGGGFPYQVTIKPTVQCYVHRTSKPFPTDVTPACYYETSCFHPNNSITSPGAGPNEDFDSCIEECDNGKYSQSCINSCYNKVYKKNSLNINTSFTNLPTTLMEKMGYSETWMKDCHKSTYRTTDCKGNNCRYTDDVHTGYGSYKCVVSDVNDPENTTVATYFRKPGCNARCSLIVKNPKTEKTITVNSQIHKTDNNYYDYIDTQPLQVAQNQAGCTDETTSKEQADALEQAQTQAAAEKKELENLANQYTSERLAARYKYTTFTYTITNKLTTKKTDTYTFTNKNGNQEGSSNGLLAVTYNDDKVTLNIPTAYLNNGNVSYDGKATTNDQKNGLNGGNKFYTSLLSTSVNDLKKWPYKNIQESITSELDKDSIPTTTYSDPSGISNVDWNIQVDIANASIIKQNQNYTINCLYGLDDPDKTPDTPEVENKPIKYIFRTVDLQTLFPNDRAPGWNWTSKAKETITDTNNGIKNYKIDPVSLIDNIQSFELYTDTARKGTNMVYADKYKEYSASLTPLLLSKIISDNKAVTYGTYNCDTTKNSKYACSSKFINKTGSITTESYGTNRYFGGDSNE